MPTLGETRVRAAALRDWFEARGAVPLDVPLLQPAATLLDLYGEDIRGRAYVTSDAVRGEQMLRPDFTVPVVEMHMAHGAEPARYTYAGAVFRRQEQDPGRASEYVQVGFEVFDRSDPAAADAEVFSLFAEALAHLPVMPVTGDIGILMAGVDSLQTTGARKAALRRHIWRPRRFRALLDRYAGRVPLPETRAALLTGDARSDAPHIGLRTRAEIEARIALLKSDAAEPPLDDAQVALLLKLLDISDALPRALTDLRGLAEQLPKLGPAVALLEAREAALQAKGVPTEDLLFQTSYGRTSMEYYDGFVFGFRALNRPDLPDVATGGRYDALTRQLGQGQEIPAVGAVMRPDVMLMLEDQI